MTNTTLSKAMNINDLPVDCLNHLFNRFALQELAQLRAICSTWKQIIEEGPFFIVKSLKLFTSYHAITRYYKTELSDSFEIADHLKLKTGGLEDDLIIANLTFEHNYQLKILFPNVTTLVVVHFDDCTSEQFEVILEFIANWSDQLVSLTVNISSSDPTHSQRFCEILNSTKTLTHLEVLPCCFFEITIDDSLTAETLSRLEHFIINGYERKVPLLSQLTNCTELLFEWINFSLEELKAIVDANPGLVENLTKLRAIFEEQDSLEFICKMFPNLVELNVDAAGPLNTNFFQAISRLPKLTSLNLISTVLDFECLVSSTKSFPTFPNLIDLKICFANTYDSDQIHYLLSTFFPNIQKLTIRCPKSQMVAEMSKLNKFFSFLRIKQKNSNEEYAKVMGRHRERYLKNLEKKVDVKKVEE